MGIIHRGATLTPHFRDFLPGWVARQPWYRGAGEFSLTPVGYFRFDDPAGAVGVETHLLGDGTSIYQVPLTYRDAPLDAPDALVSTAEHSVLGTRWIYDGTADPVWVGELLRLVATNGVSEPSGKRGVGPAEARGRRLAAGELPETAHIDLRRVLVPGDSAVDADALGLVTGTWHPAGPDSPPVSGCLAVLHPSPGTLPRSRRPR